MSSEQLPPMDSALARISSESPAPTQGINRSWSMGSYPKLSTFMASWPDVAIFRRFGALNAQNLLFLQAEITHLERELQVIRENNELNNDEKGLHGDRNWFELSQESEDGEPHPQWVVIQDIREKLREYNATLLQYKDLCALQNPSRHDLATLRQWLTRTECGDNFLEGVERNIFPHHERLDSTDHERVSDLVTLSPQAVERDAFSRWLTDELLHKFHHFIGHRFKKPFDPETGLYHYRKTHLRGISHLVGVLLASCIPAASIFTLYFVQSMVDRLGVIVAYSAIFSICLGLFTTARRVEIFGATAAGALIQSFSNPHCILHLVQWLFDSVVFTSLPSKLYLLGVPISNVAEQRIFTKFYRRIKGIRDSIIKWAYARQLQLARRARTLAPIKHPLRWWDTSVPGNDGKCGGSSSPTPMHIVAPKNTSGERFNGFAKLTGKGS